MEGQLSFQGSAHPRRLCFRSWYLFREQRYCTSPASRSPPQLPSALPCCRLIDDSFPRNIAVALCTDSPRLDRPRSTPADTKSAQPSTDSSTPQDQRSLPIHRFDARAKYRRAAATVEHQISRLATSTSSASTTHSRRRLSAAKTPPNLNFQDSAQSVGALGATSGVPGRGVSQPLPTIPGTPGNMSLSRSPSPQRGGGWSSPGLTTPYDGSSGRSSPMRAYPNGSASNVTWASAQAKSAEVKGYPSFSTRNQGYFGHLRRMSSGLPSFRGGDSKSYAEKEKLGRGRWAAGNGDAVNRVLTLIGRTIWRMRLRFALVVAFLLLVLGFYATRKLQLAHPQ